MTVRRHRDLLVATAVIGGAFACGQLAGVVGDQPVQLPVQVHALVTGCTTALFAVGLVLIYRASRIVNFAHAGLGAVGGVLFYLLVQELGWPFYAAAFAGVGASAALGAGVELTIIRRFATAPRLILTVVTIGIGQLLTAVAGQLPAWLLDYEVVFDRLRPGPAAGLEVSWFPVRFTGDHFVLAGATLAALAGIAALFRFTNAGIAVRGAAENTDRASLLGIDVGRLSTLVWLLAGALAGLAMVLERPVASGSIASGLGSAVLLRAFAAAVIARMASLPVAGAAALGIAVFDQSVFFAFGDSAIADIAVLAIILGGLLAQRHGAPRTGDQVTSPFAATEEIRPVPAQLAELPSVQRATKWVRGGVFVLVLGFPWVASPSQTTEGAQFAVYGTVAISLVVLTGWGGQISLGQFAFAAVGAAVGGAATARWGLPFPAALVIGGATGAGIAVVLGLPALRLRGLLLAVTTLAFAVVTQSFVLNDRWFGWLLPASVTRPRALFVDFDDARAFYYLTIALLGVAIWVALGLRRSRTGRVLIAMRDNEPTAQSFGINLVRTRLTTFALSGCLAAMAGVLYANLQYSVDQAAFAPEQSITMFLMAVIGGLGSVTGVLLGAVYIGLVSIFLPSSFAALLAGGVGVLVVLVVFPKGLGGIAVAGRDSYLRRVAIRNRIHVPSLLGNADASAGEIPLAPRLDGDADLSPAARGRRYELPSRIRTSGHSQAAGSRT